MTTQTAALPKRPSSGLQTLGVVSFLNALPLYESLAGRDDVLITAAVPSQLHRLLEEDRCDAALLPIVDYRRNRHRLRPISDACIASDGETMTVRVFSKVPPDQVQRLGVDGDSHTSVILAQLIWLELYDRRLDLIPRAGSGISPANAPPVASQDDESVLLIGDKVISQAPRGFGFEVDLGAAWKHLTGLPFVFAAWYGPAGRGSDSIAATLQAARDAGAANVERIAIQHGPRHGWPQHVALEYLRDIMQYTMTEEMRRAMDSFFDRAKTHGLLP
jgi:chorismate dehydratase